MHETILLLQGPIGPFFRWLKKEFEQAGHRVFKVNFNGGDQLFYPSGISYRQCHNGFRDYIRNFMESVGVTQVYLYGDCRPLHRTAVEVANELCIPVRVFEEGYVRPDFVTCELGGVNGYSHLSKTPSDYSEFPKTSSLKPARRVGYVMHRMIFFTMAYYMAALCRRKFFHGYQHHRPFMNIPEWSSWFAKLFLKPVRLYRDRRFRHLPTAPHPYFFVPLQLSNDSQVKQHSSFPESLTFIREVVASFALYAPENHLLVIKQHPMAPVSDAELKCAREAARLHGISNRVITLHEAHLPSVLKRAKGVVTINSTVGLSGLFHKAPVHCMGDAIYNMPGLTHQNTLAHFWNFPGEVDRSLYLQFRYYLEHTVLPNGSFYKRLSAVGASGLAWPRGDVLYPHLAAKTRQKHKGAAEVLTAHTGAVRETDLATEA